MLNVLSVFIIIVDTADQKSFTQLTKSVYYVVRVVAHWQVCSSIFHLIRTSTLIQPTYSRTITTNQTQLDLVRRAWI
jgi:hypothetical protein